MPTLAPPRTKPGTRKLSDVARHVVVPSGIVSTAWPSVEQKCRELGLGFDDWQHGVGRLALAKRADGQFAAGIGGVVLSIPRQVGKTYLVAAIVFALCLLTPGLTVLWTAHRMKTAGETFAKLQAFTRRKKIAPHVLKVTTGAGDEVVYFRNGSRILFGARERGFGRGFDNVDIEVFDEAQILTEAAVEDMVPATNVAANPLLFFIGTPPRPKDPGEVFGGKRREALSGEDEDTAYVEFSADEGADENDRAQWRKANPSYPKRTNDASMLRMKKALNTPGSFRREALGIWDAEVAQSAVPWDAWQRCGVPAGAVPVGGAVVFAVKFSTDGERVGAAVAVRPDGDGPVHVEAFGVRALAEGTAPLVSWLAERARSASLFLVDGKAGAGDFRDELVKAGVPARFVRVVTVDEAITAHAGMLRAIQDGSLTHFAQPGLDAQVRGAGRRKIGNAGGWGWAPLRADGDTTALDAVTLARFGAATARKRRDGGRSSDGRRAVVM